jgi:hypothetical protein
LQCDERNSDPRAAVKHSIVSHPERSRLVKQNTRILALVDAICH